MRVVLLTLFICTLSVCLVQGQSDRLYLVEQGYLKGKVLSADSESLVFLINQDSLQLRWSSLEGIKLNKNNPLSEQTRVLADSINKLNNNKLYYELGIGGHFDDSGSTNEMRVAFSGMATYRLHRYLQFGVGVDYYRYANLESVPFYFRYVGQLSHKLDRGLYHYAAIGTAKVWKRKDCDCYYDELKGRRITKAGVGYRWVMEDLSMSFSIGWLQQKTEAAFNYGNDVMPSLSSYYYPGFETKLNKDLNGIEMKLVLML